MAKALPKKVKGELGLDVVGAENFRLLNQGNCLDASVRYCLENGDEIVVKLNFAGKNVGKSFLYEEKEAKTRHGHPTTIYLAKFIDWLDEVHESFRLRSCLKTTIYVLLCKI